MVSSSIPSKARRKDRKHASEKVRVSVLSFISTPTSLRTIHGSSLSSHMEGGLLHPAVGATSRQTTCQGLEASVCFPKGTTKGLEYKELRDQAIRNTLGRKTRAIKKLI